MCPVIYSLKDKMSQKYSTNGYYFLPIIIIYECYFFGVKFLCNVNVKFTQLIN